MSITVELSAEAQAKLQESIARNDAESVQNILTEAVQPMVKALLKEPVKELSNEEFERLLKEMSDMVGAQMGANSNGLSDYAVSREDIYEGHP